jgi:Asp-tRNA(Asn)/Glu-tRNA(Gln) amidotransferase A subunit family amidase
VSGPKKSLPSQSISALLSALATHELSARELIEACGNVIVSSNPTVNAFVSIDLEDALAQAAAIDNARARREPLPLLAGIPFGVKDLEDARGFVTTNGSLLFANAPKASHDSLQVERLRSLGAIPLGKTNTPEFGWRGETTNRLFGETLNPLDPTRTPGGSSGGSAAAVAAGMVPFATGSDGGGSIRIPSALCGLAGFKTSLGRVPVVSETPPSWGELSVTGPLAATLEDVAMLLDELVTPDVRDIRSLPAPHGFFTQYRAMTELPRRVIASSTLGYAPLEEATRYAFAEAMRHLESLGVEVIWREDVFEEDPVIDWVVLVAGYIRSSLGAYATSDERSRLDPGLAEMLDRADGVTVERFIGALHAGYLLNRRLTDLLRAHDVKVLVTPTTSTQAPLVGGPATVDGVPTENWVRFTYPFNMTRSPAAVVPYRVSGQPLPYSLQLVGIHGDDLTVMQAAAGVEAALMGVILKGKENVT